MKRIPHHPAVPQAGRLQLQTDSPLFRLVGQNRNTVFQHGAKVKGLHHHGRPPALQIAHLKNIVYQGQQMLG